MQIFLRLLLLFLIIPMLGIITFGKISPCGTDYMDKKAISEDPQILERRAKLEAFTQLKNLLKSGTNDVYVIPVVVHVIHNYGEENISNEQIVDAIAILNEDFRKDNADTSIIIPQFQSIAADTRIEFRLAKLDPDGNCTDGITRKATTLTYSAGDNIKADTRWTRKRYLNIWVVANIASGAAGYSYYPGVGANKDGIVVKHDYVGSIGTGSLNRSRTLTHEVGHYLNLAHPWGSTNDPGIASLCSDTMATDNVEDTPKTIGNTTCNLNHVSCGSLDNVQNYMEYSYCAKMFTEGQKLRMRAALESHESYRDELWKETTLILTGTNDGYQALPCSPIADFSTDVQLACVGTEIQLIENSYNSVVGEWSWEFPGGIPSSSSDQFPSVVYNQPGVYSISLIAKNQIGSDTLVRNQLVTIVPSDSLASLPFYEGFESYFFPMYQNSTVLNWLQRGDATNMWERSELASSNGIASARVLLKDNGRGDISSLVTPPIQLSPNTGQVFLKFKYAYAQKESESEDELNVHITNDCGKYWNLRYTKSGYFLSSTAGVIYSESFLPSANEWKEVEKDISVFTEDAEIIMIRFDCISDRGNDIFLDDIEVVGLLNSSEQEDDNLASLYPNPITEDSKLRLNIQRNREYILKLLDIQGKLLFEKTMLFDKGENEIAIQELYPYLKHGIYMLNIQSTVHSATFKVIKM